VNLPLSEDRTPPHAEAGVVVVVVVVVATVVMNKWFFEVDHQSPTLPSL
jgi:hypothetical protein